MSVFTLYSPLQEFVVKIFFQMNKKEYFLNV